MIGGGELIAVGTRFGDMPLLHLGRRGVVFVGESFLRGAGARVDAAMAAVEADV